MSVYYPDCVVQSQGDACVQSHQVRTRAVFYACYVCLMNVVKASHSFLRPCKTCRFFHISFCLLLLFLMKYRVKSDDSYQGPAEHPEEAVTGRPAAATYRSFAFITLILLFCLTSSVCLSPVHPGCLGLCINESQARRAVRKLPGALGQSHVLAQPPSFLL